MKKMTLPLLVASAVALLGWGHSLWEHRSLRLQLEESHGHVREVRMRNMEVEILLEQCRRLDCAVVAEECCRECYDTVARIGRATLDVEERNGRSPN